MGVQGSGGCVIFFSGFLIRDVLLKYFDCHCRFICELLALLESDRGVAQTHQIIDYRHQEPLNPHAIIYNPPVKLQHPQQSPTCSLGKHSEI